MMNRYCCNAFTRPTYENSTKHRDTSTTSSLFFAIVLTERCCSSYLDITEFSCYRLRCNANQRSSDNQENLFLRENSKAAAGHCVVGVLYVANSFVVSQRFMATREKRLLSAPFVRACGTIRILITETTS